MEKTKTKTIIKSIQSEKTENSDQKVKFPKDIPITNEKKLKNKENILEKDVDNDNNEDEEKGLNKDTKRANLHFNVKSVAKWLKEFYKNHNDSVYMDFLAKKKHDRKEKERDNKKDKNNDDDVDIKTTEMKIKILNAHFAITASEETLCLCLIELFAQKSKKNAFSGLYEITYEQMLNDLTHNNDFNYTFGKYLQKFDLHQLYIGSLYDLKDRKKVDEFIDKYAFKGSGNTHKIESNAHNFIMFLLLQNRIFLAKTAFQMIKYANKTSVDYKSVMLSLDINYQDKLLKTIKANVEEKFRIIGIKSSPDDKIKKQPDITTKKTNKNEDEEESNEVSDDENEYDKESESDDESDNSDDSDSSSDESE
jgi:hypothetical protein